MANDEINAMQAVAAAIEPLSEDERRRVISWALDKFQINTSNQAPSRPAGTQNGRAAGSDNFETFAELFDAASPQIEKEKALLAAYWTQVCQGQESFGSQFLNTELKNLGHGIANITDALSQLISEKPALILQLKKGGSSKQARKTYKITEAGIRWVRNKIDQGIQNG